MRYGERIVRVVAEASGRRVSIESVDGDGRTFRSTVKWADMTPGVNGDRFAVSKCLLCEIF
jgi:hypothetical protein